MNSSAISPNKDVNELHKKLGYTFKRPDLLAEAFRHSSYTNEAGNLDLTDNERLEFLGDAGGDMSAAASHRHSASGNIRGNHNNRS